MKKRYIFHWKNDGIEVRPSASNSPEEVWAWATKWLRPAGDTRADRIVLAELKKDGEVIEVRP